jgi:hypothetical protein
MLQVDARVPRSNLRAASPVPHCASGNAGLSCNCAVIHTSSEEPLHSSNSSADRMLGVPLAVINPS